MIFVRAQYVSHDYYVSDTLLRVIYTIAFLILATTPGSSVLHYLHFADKKTEVQCSE